VAGFKDHFSRLPESYSAHRPGYPEALYDFLAAHAPSRRLAWDCATGGGQAAGPLAERFDRVLASDASVTQLSERADHPAVAYAAALAETSPLGNGSVDLVSVSQALHWFSFERFFAEVDRVLVAGGLLAAWTYPLLRVTLAVDALIDELHGEIVGAYWPPERRWVDDRYRDIPFPYEIIETPALETTARWDLGRLVGYLGTWSSVARYREATGSDPLEALTDRLAMIWGDPAGRRRVRWEIILLAGNKPGGSQSSGVLGCGS
jgi:SAM-dependent methyltransferase